MLGLAQAGGVSLLADKAKHFVRSLSRECIAGAEYPDTALFRQGPRAAYGAQDNLLARILHIEGIAGLEMQLIAQRLGNYDAAGFIDSEASNHWDEMMGETVDIYHFNPNRSAAVSHCTRPTIRGNGILQEIFRPPTA